MALTAVANVGGRFGLSTASDNIGRKAVYHWIASLGLLGAFLCYTQIPALLLIGVLPEYRKKGANALLFYHLIPFYQKYGFAWGETHVEMETNDKVQSQWMYFEHEQHKRRRCYKKVIG